MYLSTSKAPGVNGIRIELLKAVITTAVDIIHRDRVCEIWGCGAVTVNWRKVLFVRLAKEGDLTKCEPGGEHFDVCCRESVGQGVDQNKFQGCDAKSGVKQDYDMSRFLLVIDWNREKYSRGW